ncbi:MAG: septum formation protein Maf [Candidatus Marinimicrobia bacterium]|nr:septum formation protein Maf [Candidatus Neomarinimicrobiota bacterium]|tara:strand:- start:2831 stop:3448 length:618 start_codon:yes stop_codon:yes gene_type:complete
MASLILGSASPRRKKILRKIDLLFDIVPSIVDEDYANGLKPIHMAEYWAVEKAQNVSLLHPDKTVIGADTIVVLDDTILGKPVDDNDARRMLTSLSGKSHIVYTGVALRCDANGSEESFVAATEVTFYNLDKTAINRYVASGDPMDKAGAYGIQDTSAPFVEKIAGCYNNVVGFPLSQFVQLISQESVKNKFPVDNWFASDKEIA